MASKTIKILLVEDQTDYAQAVNELLAPSPSFHITSAKNFHEATSCLAADSFDVVLLDLMLPDNAGFKTFSDLNTAAPDLPVVVITGTADETLALQAVREGAQDYLVKGQLDGKTLERSVRYAIERRRVITERKASVEVLREALSDLKRAHEELKCTQLKLVQAEKIEAVSTFAAGVAHEVKNPLQTILLGLEYFSRHVPANDASVATVLQEMIHAVKRADGIVRGLMDLTNSNKREIREEDLSAIIRQAVAAVQPELTHHPILLSDELAENLPRLTVDSRSLKHVFINLLMHIIRNLSPEGGRITVRTFASTLDGPLVLNDKSVRNFKAGDVLLWAEVEEFPNRAPEARSDATPVTQIGQPNGFGLTVLKKIIELYSGFIEVTYPEDTRGTRYIIIFKAVKDPAR